MIDRIKESDWKIFKKLRPLALQRYCQRVMDDVNKIIHKNGDNHERYLAMYKIVHDGDYLMANMFNGFSRSKALEQIYMYYKNHLLSDQEIEQFSEETRKMILPFDETL